MALGLQNKVKDVAEAEEVMATVSVMDVAVVKVAVDVMIVDVDTMSGVAAAVVRGMRFLMIVEEQ